MADRLDVRLRERFITSLNNPNLMPRDQDLVDMASHLERVRGALVGLIGASTKEELESVEIVLRCAPAPYNDKVAALNAVHALLAVLALEVPRG